MNPPPHSPEFMKYYYITTLFSIVYRVNRSKWGSRHTNINSHFNWFTLYNISKKEYLEVFSKKKVLKKKLGFLNFSHTLRLYFWSKTHSFFMCKQEYRKVFFQQKVSVIGHTIFSFCVVKKNQKKIKKRTIYNIEICCIFSHTLR